MSIVKVSGMQALSGLAARSWAPDDSTVTVAVSSSTSVTLKDSIQVSPPDHVPSPTEVMLPKLPVKLIIGLIPVFMVSV